MRRLALALVVVLATGCGMAVEPEGVRFGAWDLVLDVDARPVAAWQAEIDLPGAEVVGVEGGVEPFDAPAYYDPAALASGRLVLASFSTRGALPPGEHRVATLHLMELDAAASPAATLTVAADADGIPTTASIRLVPGSAP